MIQKTVNYIIQAVVGTAVFVLCLHVVPFAQHVQGYISDSLYETKSVVIGEAHITVEIADTDEKLMRGLSGRSRLKEGKGMLFMFERDGAHGIWMKDMNFPIDIIWINKHFEVVYMKERVSPDTYPEVFKPSQPARFVIEVPAGFAENHNIKKGDLFTIL